MIKKIFLNINFTAAAYAVIIFFAYFLSSPFDNNDFGWHLKTGELIIHEKQIPYFDLFSYSMPDYKWVDYEYLFQIIIGIIYKFFGVYGISAFFGVLNSFLFIFLFPRIGSFFNFPLPLRHIFGFLLFFILSPANGARPSIFTWIFFILVFLIFKSRKKLWTLPVIFLIWANLHPGFPVGLILLMFLSGIEFLEKGFNKPPHKYIFSNGIINYTQKQPFTHSTSSTDFLCGGKKIAFIFLLSVLATFINPYFYNLHLSILNVLTDSFAKLYILEWHPLSIKEFFGLYYIIFSLLFFIVLFFTKPVKGEFVYLAVSLLFFAYGFTSFRSAPFFIFISFSVIFNRLKDLVIINDLNNVLSRKKVSVFILVILTPFVFLKFYLFPFEVQENRKYPVKAVDYLKNNINYNNIFNYYDWGGYLIWKIPEKKVFIDGRMPEWKTEEKSILKEYAVISNLKDGWDTKINNYKIDTVFLPIGIPVINGLKITGNWEEVFRDEKSVILIKK